MINSMTEYYDIFSSSEEDDDTYIKEFIFKNKLSNYSNMTKARERNTIFLLSKVKRYTGEIKARMNEIIELFAEGKIKDVLTAENIIEKIKSPNKRTQTAINNKIEKIKTTTPRKNKSKKPKRRKKREKTKCGIIQNN